MEQTLEGSAIRGWGGGGGGALTIEFEDVSVARQRADVGRPVGVDDAEGEELGRSAARLGRIRLGPVVQIRGLLRLLLLFLRVAILWLRTHLVVHCLLLT